MSTTPSQEKLQEVEAEDEGLPPPQGWRKAFAALRNPNYRHFYLGQTVSLTGTWTRTAALGWIAFPIRIFTVTGWFSLLSSLILAGLLFRGPVSIGWLMVFAFLWGTAMAFEMPACQTLMVELVGKKNLVNAIALNSAMVNTSRVVGPAIGGLLLAAFGASWCFLLDALSYLAVLYAIHKIQLPPAHYAP